MNESAIQPEAFAAHASALARWHAFNDAISRDGTDVARLLGTALEALLDAWPAPGGAIRFRGTTGALTGVRRGVLPREVCQMIARHVFVAGHVAVQQMRCAFGTLLAVPLCINEMTVGGVYMLVPTTPHATDDLLWAGRALQAALARTAALNTLQRDLRELGLIANLTRTLTTSLNVHTLLQELMGDARVLLSTEAAIVWLVSEGRRELVFEAVAGELGEPSVQRVPVNQGIAGAVAVGGEPLVIDDVAQDGRFIGNLLYPTGSIIRTMMALPLWGRDGVIGVLVVFNRRDGQPFDGHDLELATLLASQAAPAVENARLYEELRADRDRLIRREAEVRAQIGRDLHDGPVQQVAAAAMHVKFLRTVAEREPSRLPVTLDDLDAQLKQATHDLRTVLYELRPLGIEQEGLYVVLARYVAKFRDPHNLQLHLDVPPDLRRLPPQREAPTLIIVQEALNNVRKHAQADAVWIILCEVNNLLEVTIRDDGKGFDVAGLEAGYVRRGSFGLLNMRERAELIGGTWAIESTPGAGTTVTVHIPFD